ncbi:MAG: hypothetical protein FWE19_00310 [Oscillospiraceae bacterium]|nr:hypothetical protein [Oscillospiraceae bacterium]
MDNTEMRPLESDFYEKKKLEAIQQLYESYRKAKLKLILTFCGGLSLLLLAIIFAILVEIA